MNVLKIDYNSPDAPELFCQSLKETGFAVLQYHPIAMDLIEKAYSGWQNFFASEDKNQYLHAEKSQEGYFPCGAENAKGNAISDLKEFYHFYLHAKNPPQLLDITTAVYQQMHAMAATLLQWIEEKLPKHIANKLSMPLKNMIIDSPSSMLRILHYPPVKGDVPAGAVRAAEHEDINLLTLLPAATAPGLEVKDIKGHWHAVNCDPGNIVVNVADTLQMLTGHYYRSTTHRVVNPDINDHGSRYSMPLFLHARPEVQIAENFTAKDYLVQRLYEIGLYKT